MPAVLFFGGNGHCAARLEPARAVLAGAARPGAPGPFALWDMAYPGFDGRTPARDLDAFLEDVGAQTATRARPGPLDLAYATGIGALVALALRARDHLTEVPMVFQGPVLWGLERRWLPRMARIGLGPLLAPAFRIPAVQRAFTRRHFVRPLAFTARRAFFEGYSRCASAAALFRWLSPPLLRDLEERFAGRRHALEGIRVWCGARDAVVGPREAGLTEEALGVSWPLRIFPEWGHYPMIDDPEDWLDEVAAAAGDARR